MVIFERISRFKHCLGFAAVALCLMTASPQSAWARSTCYLPTEIEAEQLLRLHSKLMVTAVACRKSAGGEDLAAAYTSFTRKNLNRIKDAEQTMMSYYRNADEKNPLSKLDRLRTILANEYGQKIAQKSAPVFCAEERDSVVPMSTASNESLSNEVMKLTVNAKTYVPACAQVSRNTGKTG